MSPSHPVTRTLVTLVLSAAVCQSAIAQEIDISAVSGEADALFRQGRDAFHETWFERADELLAETLAVDPELAIGHAYKAAAEAFLYFDSDDRMARAVELADNASEGERMMVESLAAFVAGDLQSAALTLRRLISRFPDDAHARHALGFTLVDLGMAAQGIPILTELIEEQPEFSAAWNHLGYAYLDEGEVALAEQSLARFISESPHNPSARDSWADLMATTGRLDAAVASLARALLLEPGYGYAMQHMGDVLLMEGSADMARAAYARAGEVGDGYSPRFRLMNEERIAATWVRQLQFEQADSILESLGELAEELAEPAMAVTAHRARLLVALSQNNSAMAAEILEAYSGFLDRLGRDEAELGEPAYYRFFTGWHAIVAGRLTEAESAISELEEMSFHEGSVELQLAARLLGELALARLDYPAAVDALESLAIADPLVQVRLALAYEGDGKPAAAEALFEAAATCDGFDIECALAAALSAPLFPAHWALPDYGAPDPEKNAPEDDPDDESVSI
jgi:tetratricopeptide (TPR) repeat protein